MRRRGDYWRFRERAGMLNGEAARAASSQGGTIFDIVVGLPLSIRRNRAAESSLLNQSTPKVLTVIWLLLPPPGGPATTVIDGVSGTRSTAEVGRIVEHVGRDRRFQLMAIFVNDSHLAETAEIVQNFGPAQHEQRVVAGSHFGLVL